MSFGPYQANNIITKRAYLICWSFCPTLSKVVQGYPTLECKETTILAITNAPRKSWNPKSAKKFFSFLLLWVLCIILPVLVEAPSLNQKTSLNVNQVPQWDLYVNLLQSKLALRRWCQGGNNIIQMDVIEKYRILVTAMPTLVGIPAIPAY